MNRLFALALASLAGLALQTALASAPGAAPVPWEALSAADRDALVTPLRERWERATPEQQQRMLDRARRWASLTPEQKRAARAGVERYREANAERRGALREAWRRMQALPPEEREAARRAWQSLSPQQRRAWLEAGGPGVAPPPGTDPPR